jgi:hypothetical protein
MRRHRVGEGEKPGGVAAPGAQSLDQSDELVLEHGLQALPADIALRGTVEHIAYRHVVGRNGLRHRSGRAPDREEPSGNLLAATDLGVRAILRRISVERYRLLLCAGSRVIHDGA